MGLFWTKTRQCDLHSYKLGKELCRRHGWEQGENIEVFKVLRNFRGFQLNTSGQEATEGTVLREGPRFGLGWFVKGSRAAFSEPTPSALLLGTLPAHISGPSVPVTSQYPFRRQPKLKFSPFFIPIAHARKARHAKKSYNLILNTINKSEFYENNFTLGCVSSHRRKCHI